MQEVELKLELDPAEVEQVRLCRWPANYRPEKPITRTLRTIYFDTADFRLAQAGMALRLRKVGRRWVQTVKLAQSMRLGLSMAEEHECPAPGGRLVLGEIPNVSVRERVLQVLDGAPLAPVFETQMQRTERRVHTRSSVVDLAIDIGEVVAETGTEPLHELEIELVEGKPTELFDVLKTVLPKGGMALSPYSKAARGMRLARQAPRQEPELPRRAARVSLSRTDTIDAAIGLIATEVAGQMTANHRLVLDEMSADGLKQLRIGLRRLRSLLRLFKREIDPVRAAWLNAEARWLAAQIGSVRDMDVMLEDILQPELDRHDDPGLAKLQAALARRRASALRRLRPILAGERAQNLIIDALALTRTTGLRGGQDPVIRRAPKLLEKRWRKIEDMAARLDAMDIEERHELRKELKKMRYSVEYLRALYLNEDLKPFLKLLKRLQTVFGDLNDAAMAEAILLSPNGPLKDDVDAQRAVGRLIGAKWARADLAWELAAQYWEDLALATPFWHGESCKKELVT
ncbi:MAG: CHAD domain-containing protein [Pseudomonadota bacterium]